MSKPVGAQKKPRSTGHQRSFSASEIARNTRNFETWSTHQHCEEASCSDIPEEFKEDMKQLFSARDRISKLWLQKSERCSGGLKAFLKSALDASPDLFSNAATAGNEEILEEVSVVYLAWKRLRKMRAGSEKWSEAEYVANVYNVFRSPAVRESVYRVQCTVSLPQPPSAATDEAHRVLNTKTAIPDCAVFLPGSLTRPLSHSARSPYKVLKNHPAVAKAGTATRGSSFRYQSTPCTQLPDMPGFEFVSSLWEDKKPVHTLLDDAYRQNRIATASAARHLHSLNVRTPVIGLIWANGTVRAHIDWCEVVEGKPVVMSAPYSGFDEGCVSDRPFHEWVLDNPRDILEVYFLVRNIDEWTCGRFHDRIVIGLNELVESLTLKDGTYEPWKWAGNSAAALSVKVLKKENNSISITTTTSGSSTSPPKPKIKRTRRRRSSH
ncbi:hypothetical protein HYDPIDRAFT_36698 [Hydnomerulius pinastri MD-312]|nr:hypothetical protein HYDPIDRAFT_36698 [Hydnomerulius pinastri MD-312]